MTTIRTFLARAALRLAAAIAPPALASELRSIINRAGGHGEE